MRPAGFKPTFLASERPQIHALDCAATEIGTCYFTLLLLIVYSYYYYYYYYLFQNISNVGSVASSACSLEPLDQCIQRFEEFILPPIRGIIPPKVN